MPPPIAGVLETGLYVDDLPQAPLDARTLGTLSFAALSPILSDSAGFQPATESQTMPASRPRPSVMKLTDVAAARVTELCGGAEPPAIGLRVGVKNAGCAGMSYTVELATDERPGDEKVVDRNATVYIEPRAVLFLLGTEMDFERTKLRAGFVFRNPNQVSACGCGESVSLKEAEVA